MNTSMHDTFNLAWKLNLTIRGLAKPSLLSTYEHERKKIAHDLINFDYEHANAFHAGDAAALAENFQTNVRFISGVGAEYGPNVLNQPSSSPSSSSTAGVQPGCLLTPARGTRYIDANPVDMQLDIPLLGQFRLYFFCPDLHSALPFLRSICGYISGASSSSSSTTSVLATATAAAKASYAAHPPAPTESDSFIQPARYTAASDLVTYCLVTSSPKSSWEIADLPPLLQASRWSVYLDDVGAQATRGLSCSEKWVGGLGEGEVAVMNVRPDGYVGSVGRWKDGSEGSGVEAGRWLDGYYGGFLNA